MPTLKEFHVSAPRYQVINPDGTEVGEAHRSFADAEYAWGVAVMWGDIPRESRVRDNKTAKEYGDSYLVPRLLQTGKFGGLLADGEQVTCV